MSVTNWPNSLTFYARITVVLTASAFSSIKQGLTEAIGYSEVKVKKAVIHEFGPIDVKEIRANVGMFQSEFASAFGSSVSTLRHWERGDRTSQGAALVLLNVVANEPVLFLRALAS
jgi:putative transcriptional regulator